MRRLFWPDCWSAVASYVLYSRFRKAQRLSFSTFSLRLSCLRYPYDAGWHINAVDFPDIIRHLNTPHTITQISISLLNISLLHNTSSDQEYQMHISTPFTTQHCLSALIVLMKAYPDHHRLVHMNLALASRTATICHLLDTYYYHELEPLANQEMLADFTMEQNYQKKE